MPEATYTIPAGASTLVSGHGITANAFDSQELLKGIVVPIAPLADCTKAWTTSYVRASMICASVANAQDSCAVCDEILRKKI